MNAIFLDRDGTIIAGVPKYERVDNINKVELLPKVIDALRILADLDYAFFFVTNQAGIAEKLINFEQFESINNKVLELISSSGINIEETYVCPHGENDNCKCRKPKPKMLFDAAEKYGLNLNDSYMIGDRLSDVQTGINAGTKTILVQTGENINTTEANYVARDLLEAVRYIASH